MIQKDLRREFEVFGEVILIRMFPHSRCAFVTFRSAKVRDVFYRHICIWFSRAVSINIEFLLGGSARPRAGGQTVGQFVADSEPRLRVPTPLGWQYRTFCQVRAVGFPTDILSLQTIHSSLLASSSWSKNSSALVQSKACVFFELTRSDKNILTVQFCFCSFRIACLLSSVPSLTFTMKKMPRMPAKNWTARWWPQRNSWSTTSGAICSRERPAGAALSSSLSFEAVSRPLRVSYLSATSYPASTNKICILCFPASARSNRSKDLPAGATLSWFTRVYAYQYSFVTLWRESLRS